MFQVLIMPKDTTANFGLTFQTKDPARAAFKQLHDSMEAAVGVPDLPPIRCTDDFGYEVSIRPSSISYLLFADVAKGQKCFEESEFAKQTAQHAARKVIGERLEKMGFKQQPPQTKPVARPPIILDS
jgi:hypothetical protein